MAYRTTPVQPELLLLASRALTRLPSTIQTFWHSELQALPYEYRILMWITFSVTTGMLLFSLRRREPGWARLWVAWPLITLNYTVPFLFPGKIDQNTNIACYITMGISTTKALGWVINRGPLVRPLNLVQFLAVYSLPITPSEGYGAVSGECAPAESSASSSGGGNGKEKRDGCKERKEGEKDVDEGEQKKHGGRLHESAGTPMENLRNFCLKGAAATFVAFVLLNYDDRLPRIVKSFIYGFLLYCCLGMAMDGPAALVGSLIGLSIAPHFDNPYHSTTLGEFWNKRWNLTVGNVLRFCFYDPVYEGRLIKDPKVAPAFSMKRRILGMLATFFVSGVTHEVLTWYFSGRMFGHHLVFFTMWAPIIVAESACKHELHRRGIHVPKWLAWMLTNIIVQTAADVLFWEPFHRIGAIKPALAFLEHSVPWMKLQRA